MVLDVVVSAGRYSHLHFVTSADFESRSSGFTDRAEMTTAEQNKRVSTRRVLGHYSDYRYVVHVK